MLTSRIPSFPFHHKPVHVGHDLEKVTIVCMTRQHADEGLYEPASLVGVAHGGVTAHRAVPDEVVRVDGQLVAERRGSGCHAQRVIIAVLLLETRVGRIIDCITGVNLVERFNLCVIIIAVHFIYSHVRIATSTSLYEEYFWLVL